MENTVSSVRHNFNDVWACPWLVDDGILSVDKRNLGTKAGQVMGCVAAA